MKNSFNDTFFDELTVGRLQTSLLKGINSDVVLAANLVPDVDNSRRIGTASKRVNTVHNVRNYVPSDDAGSAFNSTSTITCNAGNVTPIPLSINSSVYRNNSNNTRLRVPHRGYYIVTFSFEFDVGGAQNIRIILVNETLNEFQQDYKFLGSSVATSHVTFGFLANDVNDEFSINVFPITFNLTNFQIETGRIMCASSFL
jgi:hypothetical protein